MPPPRRPSAPAQANEYSTAFGRAHPTLAKGLVMVCQSSGPLLIGTLLWTAGVLRRPMWERVTLWRAYLWTFISRWVLVSCAITWSLASWEGQNGDPAQDVDQN